MQPHDPGVGLVAAETEFQRKYYDRGVLDLRLQLVRLRSDYLNQVNTQATLVAGGAVGMLSSSELQTMDQDAHLYYKVLDYVYVLSASVCLASSLWVIYTSMNLINLSIHSTLYGASVETIENADSLVELRAIEVRLGFVVALASLVCASVAMILMVGDWFLSLTACSIFATVGWHAAKSDAGTVKAYEAKTGLTVNDRWSVRGVGDMWPVLFRPFGSDGRHYHSLSETMRRCSSRSFTKRSSETSTMRRGQAGPAHRFASDEEWMVTEPVNEILGLAGEGLQFARDRSAKLIQRMWRKPGAQDGPPQGLETQAGILFKTASGDGPIERLRQARQHSARGSSFRAVQDVPAALPRFERWFVLDDARLTVHTKRADWQAGLAPKGVVNDLRGYNVEQLAAPGDANRVVLALWPRGAVADPSDGSAGAIGGPGPEDSTGAGGSTSSGKSWYLSAADDAETRQWFNWLKQATQLVDQQ